MSYQTHTVSRSIFLIMLLLSAAVFADDKPKFGNVPDGEWAIGVPQDYADANAVVVFNNGHLTVTTDNITIEMHVRIKVLTTAGIDEVGDRSVWYNKKYDKLKGFKAHTITPDGKKHKVEKEAIFEKTSGNVVDMTFSFPTVSPGCIVEYCYRVVSERFRYLRPWYFQTDLYTLHSEFAVSLPNGFTYNIQDFNIPANCKEPVVTEQADITKNLSSGARIRTFTWTLENLPPVTEEPYMSAENDYRSALRFQLATYEDPYSHIVFQKTWSELGKLEQEWFDEYCNKRKDITKLADSVTAGLVDPRAKSRKLTAFVQTGYTTSDEYLHGFFHHEKIETLLAERMGTGEGKNLLLVELHKAAGLSAWPVLISRRDHGRLVAGNPDLQQFDYMIAVVQFDDGWEFLDASNRLNPYGLLPPDCLCGAGLLVDGEQSELVRITQKSVMSSRTDKSLLRVAADGNVSCSTSSCFTGYYAAMYTRRHDRQAEKDFIEDYYLDMLDANYTLGEYSCRGDSLDRFLTDVCFTSDEFVERLDDNLIIKMPCYAYRENPFKKELRTFPVDFNYPFVFANAVEVVCEDSVTQYTLPEDLSLESAGITFTRQSVRTDSSAVVVSALKIEKPLFLPSQYPAIRSLFERIALADEDDFAVQVVPRAATMPEPSVPAAEEPAAAPETTDDSQ